MHIEKDFLIDLAIAVVTSLITTLVMIMLGFGEDAGLIAAISGSGSLTTLRILARQKAAEAAAACADRG